MIQFDSTCIIYGQKAINVRASKAEKPCVTGCWCCRSGWQDDVRSKTHVVFYKKQGTRQVKGEGLLSVSIGVWGLGFSKFHVDCNERGREIFRSGVVSIADVAVRSAAISSQHVAFRGTLHVASIIWVYLCIRKRMYHLFEACNRFRGNF